MRRRGNFPWASSFTVDARIWATVAAALLFGVTAGAEVLEVFGGISTVKNEGTIRRSLDPTPMAEESLLTLVERAEGVKLDLGSGKMYFIDSDLNGIKRANLDGTSVETLVSGLSDVTALGLDLTNSKLYWGDQIDNKIQRSNLNGSSIEDVVTGIDEPTDIAVDASGGKVYWVDLIDGELQRANLNGSSVDTLATGTPGFGPVTVALDLGASKMYWIDATVGIRRADLDGMNPVTLIAAGAQGLGIPFSITLDTGEGKMYWTDVGTNKLGVANLDGTDVMEAHDPTLAPFFLAVDTTSRTLYWTESSNSGTGIRRKEIPDVGVITSGLVDPGGMDTNASHIYYVVTDSIETELNIGAIHRANLDGSSDITLLSSLTLPYGIALDVDGGKMYWTDPIDGLFRADLDGMNVDNIVPGSGPFGISLDLTNDIVYWTDISASRIGSSNLDGTNVQNVVTSLSNLHGIAVHPTEGKLYWTRRTGGSPGIFRANLNGSGSETIVESPTISDVLAIQIDATAGKIYWTGEGVLRRASLDGSNVEVVHSSMMPAAEFALVTGAGLDIHVDFAATGDEDGTALKPFNTLAEALVAVQPGGSITFAGGSADTDSSETPTINQTVTLQSVGGGVTVGSAGARSSAGGSADTSGFVTRKE